MSARFKVADVVDGYDQKPGQVWVRCGYSDPKNGLVHRRFDPGVHESD
ncbi:hypothetical protein ACTOVL_06790 [Arcanobacterium canis]